MFGKQVLIFKLFTLQFFKSKKKLREKNFWKLVSFEDLEQKNKSRKSEWINNYLSHLLHLKFIIYDFI